MKMLIYVHTHTHTHSGTTSEVMFHCAIDNRQFFTFLSLSVLVLQK